MKSFCKLFGILFLGLLTAIIIYPFLHESGHSIATIIVGAEVVEFRLLPLPYVACDMRNVNEFETVLIGIGGMLLPFLFSAIIYARNIWLWLGGLFINFICLLSFLISAVGCIMFLQGSAFENEDIVQILSRFPNTALLWIIVFLLLSITVIVQVILTRPFKRCSEFL